MKKTDDSNRRYGDLREIASELEALAYLFDSQSPRTHESIADPDNTIGEGIGRILGGLAKRVVAIVRKLEQ